MTSEDLEQLKTVAAVLPPMKRIGVFSPWREAEGQVFPQATALPRWRWDLNRPSRRTYDLLVACNVFMYAPDPAKWFRHVLAQSRYFLLLDLVRRQRSEGHELGPSGDSLRFGLGEHQPRVPSVFDLAELGDRLLGGHAFYGGANAFDNDPLHLIAIIRGDRAAPLLRIDDYPTGVRPVLEDMKPLHTILREVDSYGVPFHLGIVPALLTGEQVAFLRSLKHLVPVVHGYDHGYPIYAPVLEAEKDPFNERGTVPPFNEFAGMREAEITQRLVEARRLLETYFDQPVHTYIPPCNKADRRTGRALVAAGFHRVLSEKRVPVCSLPQRRSDFYGRSSEYDPSNKPDTVTLHLTWEWDLRRRGGSGDALKTLMTDLRDRHREALVLENDIVRRWQERMSQGSEPQA